MVRIDGARRDISGAGLLPQTLEPKCMSEMKNGLSTLRVARDRFSVGAFCQ